MKKELANHYMCRVTYISNNEDCQDGYTKCMSDLFADRNRRWYKTKLKASDLPNTYCDVSWRGYDTHFFNTKGVKNVSYHWVKENHWMKDSCLLVDYTGDKKSCELDYDTSDNMMWGNDIIKFLSYIKKYSGYDLCEVRSEFINQINWLKENEPEFSPTDGDAGEWFDNKIEELTSIYSK